MQFLAFISQYGNRTADYKEKFESMNIFLC